MNSPGPRERLRQTAEQAMERYVRARAENESRSDPHPGDVYTLTETADLAVLWAILEEDTTDRRYFLMIAADLDPLVGSTDVAVPEETPCGALTLRCRFQARVPARALDPAKRLGTLASGILRQVQRKRTEIVAGTVSASFQQEDTDSEPEYRWWVNEVLTKAQAALQERYDQTVATETRVADLPRSSSRSNAFFHNPLLAAASILLAIAAGFGTGLVWQEQKIKELEGLLETPPAVINLPFAFLYPKEKERTEAIFLDRESIVVPEGSDLFLLVLGLSELQSYTSFRLEIHDKETNAEVGSYPELKILGVNELSIALRPSSLPAGGYWLSLWGVDAGTPKLVAEYALRIDNE